MIVEIDVQPDFGFILNVSGQIFLGKKKDLELQCLQVVQRLINVTPIPPYIHILTH